MQTISLVEFIDSAPVLLRALLFYALGHFLNQAGRQHGQCRRDRKPRALVGLSPHSHRPGHGHPGCAYSSSPDGFLENNLVFHGRWLPGPGHAQQDGPYGQAGRQKQTRLTNPSWRDCRTTCNRWGIKSMGREYLATNCSLRMPSIEQGHAPAGLQKAALRASQEPLMTLVVSPAYTWCWFPWDGPVRNMVLIFLMARMLNEFGKAQRSTRSRQPARKRLLVIMEKIQQAKAVQGAPRRRNQGTFERSISIDRVDFGYGDKVILRMFSLRYRAGRSPHRRPRCRENDPVDLITGFSPHEGGCLIDGIPLSAIDLQSWAGTWSAMSRRYDLAAWKHSDQRDARDPPS